MVFSRPNLGVPLALLIATVIWLAAGLHKKRIEPSLGGGGLPQIHTIGKHRIDLLARTLREGDDGSVELQVTIDGAPAGSIPSYFNYDTLMDIPAGYTCLRWIDRDLTRDLVIMPQNSRGGQGPAYYIGSRNGTLLSLSLNHPCY